MFWRRREQDDQHEEPEAQEPVDEAPAPAAPPTPTTVPRPARGRSGMGGLGLRSRPSGLGARLRAILGAGAATEETWEEIEEALVSGDVGAEATLELVDAARERYRRAGGRSGGRAVGRSGGQRGRAGGIRDAPFRCPSGRRTA